MTTTTTDTSERATDPVALLAEILRIFAGANGNLPETAPDLAPLACPLLTIATREQWQEIFALGDPDGEDDRIA